MIEARSLKTSVTKRLDTKGVSFGQITANANGTLDLSGVEGIDTDLIVKPFHQKGVVNSVLVFTVNVELTHAAFAQPFTLAKRQKGSSRTRRKDCFVQILPCWRHVML